MSDPSDDYDLPIDWEDWSAERRHQWMCRDRARRQHERQSTVSVEDRVDVHESRKTTLYCTKCGEEHRGHGRELNYCRNCGESL